VESDLTDNKLTREIIGIAFEIYNKLGYGLAERVYQKSFQSILESRKIKYSREKYGLIKLNDVVVGKYYIDFMIGNKIAVELKVRNEIYQTHINQLLNYIKSENIRVGLLLVISKDGVLIKRIINNPCKSA
jgi:GxxExxY protein